MCSQASSCRGSQLFYRLTIFGNFRAICMIWVTWKARSRRVFQHKTYGRVRRGLKSVRGHNASNSEGHFYYCHVTLFQLPWLQISMFLFACFISSLSDLPPLSLKKHLGPSYVLPLKIFHPYCQHKCLT